MTEEELAQIEEEYGWLDRYETDGWHGMALRVPALLAEVRRLRAALAAAQHASDLEEVGTIARETLHAVEKPN